MRCRSCGCPACVEVLDLGRQPLANALRREDELDRQEPRHELRVAACPACSLVQLVDSVSPDELFGEYPYFSSVSPALVAHAGALVERTVRALGLGPGSLAMEIASNDGYLLCHYRDAGVPVLGVDPARNVAAAAERRGIPTVCAFFGRELAERLEAEGRRPDVLHANNVLAHVPDLNGVVAGIAALIGEQGRLVTESPYLKDLLDGVEFDTIYHEHLCYFSLTAQDRLFERHGLVVEDVEHLPIHGGSLRLTVRAAAVARRSDRVVELLETERAWGVDDPATYGAFGARVRALGRELRALLDGLRADGARVAAYGAAAKGSTLLNTFGLGREHLGFIADASPHKQGLRAPGTALPIVPPERLLEERPDYCLLLAWNFADEIVAQQSDYLRAGGRFIVPLPEPRVL